MKTRLLIAVFLSAVQAFASGLSCPAGMPLGGFQLTVTRTEATAPIPLNRINQLEEGDKIHYAPTLRAKEKRPGQVSVVLIALRPSVGEQQDFTVLQPKAADKAAEWTVPYRSSLAIYVYGPSGLSTRRLKGYLSNDKDLVAQLADYAEKTEKTEAVLLAVATYEVTGHADGLQAAITGFAGQYGNTGSKLDRTASLDQQGLAALRTLNPALSAYDPISNPASTQRVAQTTALAATVAGMFLGSTVGLAAGGAALTLNLKTLMFPDTEFRSAYTQPLAADSRSLSLCSSREATQSRKRRAYLWAVRVPAESAPAVLIQQPNHIPVALRTAVPVRVPAPKAKLVSRAREWSLQSVDDSTRSIPVTVIPTVDAHALDINLGEARIEPGRYRLTALWDWDRFEPLGDIWVHSLSSFGSVELTPESQIRLREHAGKQVVTLAGDDFQFVERVTLVRKGDKYASPVVVPFTLPQGQRKGPQSTLEMQVDTGSLTPGEYTLSLTQQGGEAKPVEVSVLPEPPKIAGLPLTINRTSGEDDLLVLRGEGLDRITALDADGVRFELTEAAPGAKLRVARIQTGSSHRGPADLKVHVRDYAAPLTMSNALLMAGVRPRIREAQPSLPADMPVALRAGELPAGVYVNLLLRVEGGTAESRLELGCSNVQADRVTLRPGSESDRVKLQTMQAGSMFLALDAGRWPAGCQLTATIDAGESGKSKPFDLGRVVRLPVIESFRLTDEPAGDGMYFGVLTGRDLELIGKTGWDAQDGQEVAGLPAPVAGGGDKQSLKVKLTWPSPAPHAPLYLWFRGEKEGRATTARY